MREFSITQNLLDTALKHANSKRIVKVNLLIGPFSEEREESIRFYWRDLSKGTLGEGARLHFQHIPVETKCIACGGTLNFEDDESLCKHCQNDCLQLLNKDEVELESIDVE
jgi:hydrogenase nickel incorporation protein HypA/HybF